MANTTIFGQDMNKNLAQKSICAPVGEIFFFAKSTPPEHALACDGAAVSREAYPELFRAIGTTFGSGDGSTTFNVPDLRGEFVRGWDNGRGVDSGRTIGSSQQDEIISHRHLVNAQSVVSGAGPIFCVGGSSTSTSNDSTLYTGGTETRPRNIALLPCIIFE